MAGQLYHKEGSNIDYHLCKIVNSGILPSYIQDLIPPLVSKISDYPLRNNRNISVPLN